MAFVLRTLREEPVVAGVKLSNQSVHSTSSVFDHIGQIYRPNFREKKFFFSQKLRALPLLQVTSNDDPKKAAHYR